MSARSARRSRSPLVRRKTLPLPLLLRGNPSSSSRDVIAAGRIALREPKYLARASSQPLLVPYNTDDQSYQTGGDDTYFRRSKSPKRQRVAAPADTDKYGLTAQEMQKRETLRPGPATAHQLQGLDSLGTNWEMKDLGSMPKQAQNEPCINQTPSATSEFVKQGKELIRYVPAEDLSVLSCLELNKSTEGVHVTKKVSHSNFPPNDIWEEDKVKDIFTKVAVCNYLSGQSVKKNYHWLSDPLNNPFRKNLENFSSLQVQILAANMGDMFTRKMYIAGTHKVPPSIANKVMPMFHAWASAGAHIWLTAEATNFDSASARILCQKYGLIGCVACPNNDTLCNCQPIACHIKNAGNASVTLLEQMWETWSEASDKLGHRSWSFGGCIFEVDFGKDKATQKAAHRCGRERYVVAMFHLNNEAAKKPDKARELMLRFLRLCVKRKADAIFGDGNQAVNMSQKNQETVDRLNSTCAMTMRQTQLTYNNDKEIWERFSVYPVEGESSTALNAPASARSNYDTMIGWVLSWSKDTLAAIRRKEIQETTYELRRRKRERGTLIAQGAPVHELPPAVTPEEEDFVSQTGRVGWQNSKNQLDELKVSVSEFAKHMTNHDLFLEEGNDGKRGGGWHYMLNVTIRQSEVSDRRVRGRQNPQGKPVGNPYSSYATKLSFAALSNLVVQSTATNASASCPVASTEDEGSGMWMLYLLLGSLLLNMMVLVYFLRCRSKQAAQEPQNAIQANRQRCSNPECDRWANPPFDTCCQACPRQHTGQCDVRTALVAYPWINERPPVRRRNAEVQTGSADFDWTNKNEVGIYEKTTNVFHFHDNCHFMKTIRTKMPGRFYRPCRICYQHELQEGHGR